MAVYFASDMHLRLDRPDRAERLARWVESLNADDRLYLVGDVCDFWFASRQRTLRPVCCPGLRALASFRARGGALTILPGNHDLWLGPFYEKELGATFLQEPLRLEVEGLRLHLVHGHRSGGRQPWKAGMETHAFLTAFEHLPGVVARRLDHLLDESNNTHRARDEGRLIPYFRAYADTLRGTTDLAVFGHVHKPHDDPNGDPRLVVLGGWHRGSSYLRLDGRGVEHVVIPAPAGASEPGPVTA